MENEPQNEQNEQDKPGKPNEPKPVLQPSLRDGLKLSYAVGKNVVVNAREVTGRPRQIVIGAMLGTSLAFIIVLISVQNLDTPLTIASTVFIISIPFLVMDLIVASQDFKSNAETFMVNMLKFAAFRVCEFLGGISVIIGIGAVAWHFSGTTLIMLIAAVVIALLTPGAVLTAIIVWPLVLDARARRTKSSEPPKPPTQ
jgi:hypothetical protein